jgi:hypothetical protein
MDERLRLVAFKGQEMGKRPQLEHGLLPSDRLGYADQGQRGSNRGHATR